MKKKNILRKNADFTRIINSNKPFKYKDFVIYLEKGTNQDFQFGVSVSTKVGNAVVRNKLKRQAKSVIMKKDYQKGFNCIIILGRGILDKNYQEIENNLLEALSKLDIFH